MSTTYKPTDYPGVRYREHPTRRRGARPDRYFVIRYVHAGKTHEEALGWASQGFSAEQASHVRGQLRQNQKLGRGPVTLAQMRGEADLARIEAADAAKRLAVLPVSFDKLASDYLEWARNNKKDHASDERRLRLHILPMLGHLGLGQISQPQIETLKVRLMEKDLAPATVKHCVILVRRIFNHGRLAFGPAFADLVRENPVTGVKIPATRNGRTRYLKNGEVALLLERAKLRDPQMHDIILLCLYTGLRRGEVERLEAGDVDLDAQVIHIRDAKSGRDETVGLPEFLVPMLNDLVGHAHMDLVFPSTRTDGQLTSISPRFRKLVDALGFNSGVDDPRQRVSFHTLRHTFVSRLVLQGEDLRTVQELARHRSFEMTLRYSHLSPDRKRRAVNRLEQPGSNVVPFPAKNRQRS